MSKIKQHRKRGQALFDARFDALIKNLRLQVASEEEADAGDHNHYLLKSGDVRRDNDITED